MTDAEDALRSYYAGLDDDDDAARGSANAWPPKETEQYRMTQVAANTDPLG